MTDTLAPPAVCAAIVGYEGRTNLLCLCLAVDGSPYCAVHQPGPPRPSRRSTKRSKHLTVVDPVSTPALPEGEPE